MRLPPPIDHRTILEDILHGKGLPPVDHWRRGCDLAVLNRWERTRWLRTAMREKDDEAVDFLLNRGFATYALSGPSCLLWSAFGALRLDYLSRLISLGCDPNCYDHKRQPILFAALDLAYPGVVKVLLDGGADPDTKFREWYPLDWADQYTEPLLLATGATMKHT